MQREGIRDYEVVMGVKVNTLMRQVIIERIRAWIEVTESRYVCALNVHSLVTSFDDKQHYQALSNADIVIPDGEPIAYYLRKHGHPDQKRITGPGLMGSLCDEAAKRQLNVYLFGSTEKVLSLLEKALKRRNPDIRIVGSHSPPFRDFTEQERMQIIDEINGANVQLLFVGLGCPKQERWMSQMKGRINAVMIGVGAAFDFYAGTAERAPKWMRQAGLEWLFRLLTNPRRLFWRYLTTNTRFLWRLWLEKRR